MHGGYPTPSYDEAPARRRAESERLFGHPGAAVSHAVESALHRAGHARKVGGGSPRRPVVYQIHDEAYRPIGVGTRVRAQMARGPVTYHYGTVVAYDDDYDCDHDGESFFCCKNPGFTVRWDGSGETEEFEGAYVQDRRYRYEGIFVCEDVEVVLAARPPGSGYSSSVP